MLDINEIVILSVAFKMKKSLFVTSLLMIIGHGIDVLSIRRFEKVYQKYPRIIHKILSPVEIKELPSNPLRYISNRWAFKEALYKVILANSGWNS